MFRLFVCLLVVCACVPVFAREVRLQSANGDGGTCPEAAPSETIVQLRNKDKHVATTVPGKPRPSTYRGDDVGAPHMPRWHSFVPGMFR